MNLYFPFSSLELQDLAWYIMAGNTRLSVSYVQINEAFSDNTSTTDNGDEADDEITSYLYPLYLI